MAHEGKQVSDLRALGPEDFGHPCLEWPPASALAALLVTAVGGTVLASVIAERTPKVA